MSAQHRIQRWAGKATAQSGLTAGSSSTAAPNLTATTPASAQHRIQNWAGKALGTPPAGAQHRIQKWAGKTTAPVGGPQARHRIQQWAGTTSSSVAAVLTGPAALEPFETGRLDASDSGQADAWAFSQPSGLPTITLVGTGPTRTLIAPPLTAGIDITFRVTVTKAGYPDSTADLIVHIYPVVEYIVANDRTIKPVEQYQI